MIKVYGMTLSGNCHKVRLLLDLIERPYEWIETDTREEATRTPEFLALNPHGQVPAVILEDGEVLPESNAILLYFAQNTRLFPDEPLAGARVLQWMFFEQYSHEPYIAVNRAILSVFKTVHDNRDRFQANIPRGYRALDVMERRLTESAFFAGSSMSIADIALYAYTHVAHEGGFDLEVYPEVRRWLLRVVDEGLRPMPACG